MGAPRIFGLAAAALVLAGATAGPMRFGRLFERWHSAVVAIRHAQGWSAGFVVGGGGEVLLGRGLAAGEVVEVLSADGQRRRARVLGPHPKWDLSLARVDGWSGVRPLRASRRPRFDPEGWALVLSVSDAGAPEPFAGVFLAPPSGERPWARLMAESRTGAAVLNAEGRLIGVALDDARRRTRVLPLSTLMPFLRQTVTQP